MRKYKTILADPPWPQTLTGKYARRINRRINQLPYRVMSLEDIVRLPVADIADEKCHLWLWTTNQFLHAGFHVMEVWGFKYLAPITFQKPSGLGNYFIHVTQTVLFGYKGGCEFPKGRYLKTLLPMESPRNHSQKPQSLQDYIEYISPEPRIELFSRRKRLGWDAWGNEVDSDIVLESK